MIVLLAPKSNSISGGYIYNRSITAEMPENRFMYLQLPAQETSVQSFGVPSDATLLLDSLYFSSPDWVVSLKSHSHSSNTSLAMLVHYLPSLDPTLPPAVAKELQKAETTCLSCCTQAVVTSYYMKSVLAQRAALEPALQTGLSLSVAQPGLNAPDSTTNEPPAAENEALWPEAALRLLTVANWTAAKNHRFLLPVLSDIDHLPWSWEIVGQADQSNTLIDQFRQTARHYGLANRIRIEAQISPAEVLRRMQQADLFLYPSRFESYGMVVAEALAAGLPTIANRTGGIPEIVGDTEAAILCTTEQTATARGDWGRAIRLLMDDRHTRTRLSRAAVDRARDLPSWSDTAATILAALEQN